MTASSLLSPQRYPYRWLAAAAAAIAATAHIPVIGPHLEEAPYMGILFIVLTVACFTLALAMIRSDTPAVYLAAAATCGTAVIGYALTRLIPFPLLADDVGNWLEPLGVLSVLAETTVLVLAVAALHTAAQHRPNQSTLTRGI
jgi:hypothetical protein